MSLKLEKIIFITINYTTRASPVVFDAIDASYGPIESIPWLGSGGGGEEGRQNMGDTGAILGGRKLSF